MKLSKFCEEDLISFSLKSKDKNQVLHELADLAGKSKLVKDKEDLYKALVDRERLVTTGIGYGVAFPHAKTKAVRGIIIAFGRSDEGIEFEAMDRKPVHLFFLITAPEDASGAYLSVMGRLSTVMKSDLAREKLMKVSSPKELLEIIDMVD